MAPTELTREVIMHAIREILAHHQGYNNPIKMQDLHRIATGETIIPKRAYDQTRITRSIVEQLRREGLPIASRGGSKGGYYIAQNQEELNKTIDTFHGRAMSSLRQEAALRRIPFERLLKQYQLEFKQEETGD